MSVTNCFRCKCTIHILADSATFAVTSALLPPLLSQTRYRSEGVTVTDPSPAPTRCSVNGIIFGTFYLRNGFAASIAFAVSRRFFATILPRRRQSDTVPNA